MKRGPKPKPDKSISVHCRVPFDFYQLLQKEVERRGTVQARNPGISAVLMDLAKSTLLNTCVGIQWVDNAPTIPGLYLFESEKDHIGVVRVHFSDVHGLFTWNKNPINGRLQPFKIERWKVRKWAGPLDN